MSISPNIVPVIELAAQRHNLPAALVTAIIQVESSGNTYAIRYESGFLLTYVKKDVKCFGASRDTERISRATSWGLMQVMGQVARELGCEEHFLSSLCEPVNGIEYGCRQLARFRDKYFGKFGWEGVIASYNAGSPRRDESGEYVNQGYVMKVLKYFKL
ncbi:MAG: lytic transglycosylase domain-containing protein [Geobacteraceae bacterium]|nr:lytic transglycosylase domain-containing protein [Geobacteraceae bacterium]